ncbi:IS1 family transposase [Klebsiella pneumoniae]|nr:IS1 family transposase [Klebsiella pneumoniae]EKV7524410.1 IS1 family transposase [Klebsiella pneumoniae]EKW8851121.1 IS1 family transposase [Klebsiella pneumoniae]EKW8856807.1 IS1 family transposase [Klebsiella pneumoniae]EKW8862701.1 IS1 family transposase [Klebsiella pneumoniae]
MATVTVHCPRCDSDEVYRHGLSPTQRERFRCQSCRRVFQLSYRYEARTLKIGINTVIRGFKKLSPRRITSSPVAYADVALICELDEQWTFVGSKALQHWLWYAYNTKTGGVLAYTFGPPNDETCRELLALLTPFSIGMITSDDWGSYAREAPKEKHLTGKIFTQRIERNNLTLRTRIKRLALKTICFSRSIDVHEKVIGSFIEKYMFY